MPGTLILAGDVNLKSITDSTVPFRRLAARLHAADVWADAGSLGEFRDDIEALRPQVDIVVASCHWGLGREPLQYMTDIARTAIDAGADVVMGHGPHYPLPVEIYKGRPLFYGLGNLTFSAGHLGRRHAGWIGMLVEIVVENGSITNCNFRFVRSNVNNESYLCLLADEAETLADLDARSSKLGATFKPEGDCVRVMPFALRLWALLVNDKIVSDNAARSFAKGWQIERQLLKILGHLAVLELLSAQRMRARERVDGVRQKLGG
jgi:hypothetical protein